MIALAMPGSPQTAIREFIMRYYPVSIALALVAAVTSSAGLGQERAAPADPRSDALLAAGQQARASGDLARAIDSIEAALAVDPGNGRAYVALAEIAREQKLQGKAIRLYREALELDPQNRVALSGEGEALVERGAVEKARRNLARLQTLCGKGCAEARELSMALAKGPPPKQLSVEAIAVNPVVSEPETEQP